MYESQLQNGRTYAGNYIYCCIRPERLLCDTWARPVSDS